MDRASPIGRILFAGGLAAIGCQDLIGADFVGELQPVSALVPWHPLWAWILGVLLIATCAGVVAGRRRAAVALAVLMSAWVVVLWVPSMLAHPTDGGRWTGAFEIASLTAGAWILAGAGRAGRIGFGLCLPAFGVLHFVYVAYVASVIPAWIPGHVFWAYATGVAHIAAGLAIASGVLARLAATLLAIMFGAWAVLLHVPRVAAHLHDRPEWTSLFVVVAMCGAAAIAAASLPGGRAGADRRPVAAR
ncbi:MAG TPA: hypothetical protein VK698_24000 [Kofleriaceae bacterium]|nr:hypothetical protein [Kofleriaceae bacterium]